MISMKKTRPKMKRSSENEIIFPGFSNRKVLAATYFYCRQTLYKSKTARPFEIP